MHKDILVTLSPSLDLVFDQARSACFDPLDSRSQVRHPYRDMVQALTTLLDKLRDQRIAGGGFEQLEPRTAHWKHDNFDFLVLDDNACAGINTECIPVERKRCVNRANSDSDMVNFGGTRFFSKHRNALADELVPALGRNPNLPDDSVDEFVRIQTPLSDFARRFRDLDVVQRLVGNALDQTLPYHGD